MTYPKLKPCPCGSDPFLFGYEGWNGGISSWRVECDDCGYIGSCEGRKLDSIRSHNARANALAAAASGGDAEQAPGDSPAERPEGQRPNTVRQQREGKR